jgi:hypothetical protein
MLPRLWRGVRRTSANKIHTISADTDPLQYVLRALRSVKSAELEQSLLTVPLCHLELLVCYTTILSKSRRGVVLFLRVAIHVKGITTRYAFSYPFSCGK